MHGMALNITCLSYHDMMNVGFVGCRAVLPHLQRLALHTVTALQELAHGLGLTVAPEAENPKGSAPSASLPQCSAEVAPQPSVHGPAPAT